MHAMRKKLSILLAGALVASVFSALPARAATTIPDEVQIEDPLNDGNFLNDQGFRADTGFQGNNSTPADASTVGDLLKVWFTHTAKDITIHYQSEKPGPATTSIVYQTFSNPGEGPVAKSAVGCLRWVTLVPGVTYQGKPVVKLIDRCNEGANIFSNGVAGEYTIEAGPDGTGILSVTFPRDYSPLLADDKSIERPFAETRLAAGGETPAATTYTSIPMIDNTKDGIDYKISTGGGAPSKPEEPKAEPPGKNDPPGQGNQDCSKIKNKKKKKACKKNSGKGNPPAAKGCADFKPGERGAEVEDPTVKLTDEHTEEAPLEYEVELGQSLADVNPGPLPAPFAVTADAFNVQVDTKGDDVGVWALFQFPTHRDYDIDMFHSDGSYAARASGFNPMGFPAPVPRVFASGHGGEYGFTYEKLLGIRTANCGGWTMEASNHLGEGGKFKIKLWLGEAVTDPLEPGKAKP
jgi:hypothetical protein